MKKNYFFIVGSVVLVAAIILASIFLVQKRRTTKHQSSTVSASSSSKTITLKSDWEEGGTTNQFTDTSSSPGDVKINLSSVSIDVESITSVGNVTGYVDDIMDGSTSTGVSIASSTNNGIIFVFDRAYFVSKIRIYSGDQDINASLIICAYPKPDLALNCSAVGLSDHANLSALQGNLIPNNWKEYDLSTQNQYTVTKMYNSTWDVDLREVEFFGIPLSATHTSAPAQISGGDTFWGWETFTPTYTEPANTDVQFRFRTSTNNIGWTDWTDYQTMVSGVAADISDLVTSRTGEDEDPTYSYYKYIQVETTLISTDGVSTPTVSDYSIGYHTNVAPSKPVGGTAIIGQ